MLNKQTHSATAGNGEFDDHKDGVNVISVDGDGDDDDDNNDTRKPERKLLKEKLNVPTVVLCSSVS